jgi:hypothetical protein
MPYNVLLYETLNVIENGNLNVECVGNRAEVMGHCSRFLQFYVVPLQVKSVYIFTGMLFFSVWFTNTLSKLSQ